LIGPAGAGGKAFVSDAEAVIHPAGLEEAIPNPLKGFRAGADGRHPYGTLAKTYLKWCDLEAAAEDDVDRIRQVCQERWKDAPAHNIKVIPRVFLYWPRGRLKGAYWPADLPAGDYSSSRFKDRLVRLIHKLGAAWDHDPRVAFVETGLIGFWGEHHRPSPSPEIQKLMGDAFAQAFSHKLLMQRHGWEFLDYRFGIYWDSFAHPDQFRHRRAIEALGDRWKTAPIGGETAFDWGRTLGADPTDAMVNHLDELTDAVRDLHANHCGWIAAYDRSNPAAAANAGLLQKAFGYRFVLEEVRYSRQVGPGGSLQVALAARNTGSGPLYYNWPLEAALLEADTRRVAWRGRFEQADLRTWIGGDWWDHRAGCYRKPAPLHRLQQAFALPEDLPAGRYVLALAILDPAGDVPSVRFATSQYFAGGRHPIGWVGVGGEADPPDLPASMFDNPLDDHSLHYVP
jgi:hypothetical protein